MRRILCLLGIFFGHITAVISQQQSPCLSPTKLLNSNTDQGLVEFAEEYGTRHCSIATGAVERRGGIFIGALFQLHENFSTCTETCSTFLGWDGVEQTEAFFFAIEKLLLPNDNLWSTNGLGNRPWERFGWIVRDTCSSRVLAAHHALDYSVETKAFGEPFYLTSACTCTTRCVCGQSNPASNKCGSFLQAVIGPGSDEEVAAVSTILTSHVLPHISFSARSSIFNDVHEYPYLFRTVPAINNEVSAIIDLIEFFGWQYISVVVGDDDLNSGRDVDLFQNEQRTRQTFCIGHLFRFSQKRANFWILGAEMARALRKDEKARVLVLFASSSAANSFLDIMEVENVTGKIIIGSLDWVSVVALDRKLILRRSMAVFGFTPRRLVRSRVDDWIAEYESIKANSSSPERRPGLKKSLLRNPWLRAYLEDKLQCRFEGGSLCPALDKTVFLMNRSSLQLCKDSHFDEIGEFPVTGRVESVMFAVEVLVMAVQQVYTNDKILRSVPVNDTCFVPHGRRILKALQKLTMPCVDDINTQCFVFDENQQISPSFNLQQLVMTSVNNFQLERVGYWVSNPGLKHQALLTWTDPPDEIHFTGFSPQKNSSRWPLSSCNTTCKPGQKRFFYDEKLVRCCWLCEQCPQHHFSNSTNSDDCLACALGTTSSAEFDRCVPSNIVELHYSDIFVTILVVLASIGVILTLLIMMLFCRHRDHTIVRASDFYITMVILGSSLVCHVLSPFSVGTGHLTETRCRFFFLLLAPWKITVIAAILVKTSRFVQLFRLADQLKHVGAHQAVVLRTPVQICIILIITVIGFGLGFAYTSTITVDMVYPSQTERRVICSGSLLWDGLVSAYHISLLVVVVVLAFLTRKLPENYNEAQQLYFTALATLVVWAGFTPALYTTDSNLRPLIGTYLAEAQMWAVALFLYVPRLVLLIRIIHNAKTGIYSHRSTRATTFTLASLPM